MFSWLWALIIGLIVGVIARFLLPGKESLPSGALGILITAIVGVLGALLGTWIGQMIWGESYEAAGWIMSILGAVILLLIVRLFMGRSTNTV